MNFVPNLYYDFLKVWGKTPTVGVLPHPWVGSLNIPSCFLKTSIDPSVLIFLLNVVSQFNTYKNRVFDSNLSISLPYRPICTKILAVQNFQFL